MRRNGRRAGNASPVYPVPYIISRRARVGPLGPLGLQDPSYVADTPHDLWISIQQGGKFPSTRSAEELEAWIRGAPELGELVELKPLDRRRYDGGGRLLAKWILEHFGRYPQDVRQAQVVQRELLKANPKLGWLQVSTAQWIWAFAAAHRIWDAHQEDD